MELVRTFTGRSEKSRQSHEQSRKSIDLEKPQPIPSGSSESWAGHYNRLDKSQQATLAKFKTVLQEQKLYTPEPPSHDDPTLIRYLRARRWDINGAVTQFRGSAKARSENRVDELYEHIDVDFYEKARVLYPQFTGHRDRRGLPLYVYQIKHLDSKTISTYTKEATAWKKEAGWKDAPAPVKLLPLYALYQNLLTLVIPLCSSLPRPDPDVPITQCTNIVDVSGVGIKTFWNLKSHMQEASTIANTHFPETLDRIFIIGAPYFFPTVWGWIKRWFDPGTVSKIFILGQHDMKSTLERFFEPSSIPKAYGGDLDWEYGQLPNPDAEIRKAVGHEWIHGPARWEGQYVPLGTIGGKQRERPAPLPKVEQNPLVDASRGGDTAPNTIETQPGDTKIASTKGDTAADQTTAGVAALTIAGSEKISDHPSVENQGAAGTARIAIPDENSDSTPRMNGTETSTTKPTEILGAAINNEEKHTSEPNGVAKPPLERFETAAETLPNGSA